MRTARHGIIAGLAATSCALLALSSGLAAQPNPLPPGNVTIVVPFTAGGPLDVVARILADKISARHARAIVVENKAGAGGNIGAAQVARAEPNGLTWMLMVDSLFTVNPHLYANMGFDPDKDLAPVGQLGQVILMLAVHPKVPARSWSELSALSRTKPLNFGSAGVGAPGHLALEYLKMASPLDAAHVPFRGASAVLTELVAGNVDAAFIVAGVMVDHVRAGTLRPLAVSDSRRMALFPDVPTAAEAGIGDFEARFSNILAVPARTPQPVRDFLRAEIAAVAGMPDVRAKLAAAGSEPLASDEAETRAWIARERERWGKVIKARGLKPPQ